MAANVQPIFLGLSFAFLIEVEDGVVLIDAGMPGSERLVWAGMRKQGFRPEDLRLVVLTHAHIDHCGCLPALLRSSGALLAAHPRAVKRLRGRSVPLPRARGVHGTKVLYRLTRRWLPNPRLEVDVPLEDGADLQDWGLAARVLHTPGHTADSLTVFLEDGMAFVGDLLVRRGQQICPQPYFIEDGKALAASLARLARVEPQVVCASHCGYPLEPIPDS